jgi:uncharacterized protein with beta-barrel porin domain
VEKEVAAVAEGWRLTPQASVGVTHFLTDNAPTAEAEFADGSDGFSARSDLDRTYLDLELGVDLASAGGVGLRATGQLGQDTERYGGALKLTMAF